MLNLDDAERTEDDWFEKQERMRAHPDKLRASREEQDWFEKRKPTTKAFWRKEEPVVEENKETNIPEVLVGGMFPHQLKWWNSTAFIKVLVSGYGAGKNPDSFEAGNCIINFECTFPGGLGFPYI